MSTTPSDQLHPHFRSGTVLPNLAENTDTLIHFERLLDARFLSDGHSPARQALARHWDLICRLVVVAVILLSFLVGVLISHV